MVRLELLVCMCRYVQSVKIQDIYKGYCKFNEEEILKILL